MATADYSILDTESKAFMDLANAMGPLDLTLNTVDQLREMMEITSKSLAGDFEFQGTKEDMIVNYTDIENAKQSVPLTVLRSNREENSWNNVLVYFHGGGFVWGSRKTHMRFCEMISQACDCVVVNVEYRLAPENRYPSCMNDAIATAKWCLSNKSVLANNSNAVIGVAGDSAGGNIAAGVCHNVDGFQYQILIYPTLDMTGSRKYHSAEKYGTDFLLTEAVMKWFGMQMFDRIDMEALKDGSPLCRNDCSKVPPALILVAECDPLADESTAYHNKLEKDGVRSELVVLKGTIHGFVEKPGFFKDTTERTIRHVTKFLSKL